MVVCRELSERLFFFIVPLKRVSGVLHRPLTSAWLRKVLTKARREPAPVILVTCRLRPAALCPGLQPSATQIALKHTHSKCCCLPSGCESHHRVSYFSRTFCLTGSTAFPHAYADGERRATSIKSEFPRIGRWDLSANLRGAEGDCTKRWNDRRAKKQETYSDICFWQMSDAPYWLCRERKKQGWR